MKRLTGIITIFVFLQPVLHAQDVTISASIDKNSYLIGDHIYLRLSANAQPSTKLFWPAPEEIAPFEIISVNPIDTASSGNLTTFNQVIVYSVYDSGTYIIPPLRLQYKKAEEELSHDVYATQITFRVNTIEVDTTAAIKPVKGIYEVQVKNYLWLYILCGVLGLGLIAAIVYYFKSSKKRIQSFIPKVKAKSLTEATTDKLKELDQKKLWQKGETKRHYIELTDILRSYLESRYNILAMESTSDEIISYLIALQVPSPIVDDMTFILRTADMAKFAKSNPQPDDNMLAMKYAFNIVEATKPGEPVDSE